MFIGKPRPATLRHLPFVKIIGMDENEALHVVRHGKRRDGKRVGAQRVGLCQTFAARHRELWLHGLV